MIVRESFVHILVLNVPFEFDTEECFDRTHWSERQNKQNKPENYLEFEMDEKKSRDKIPFRFPGGLLDSFDWVEKAINTLLRIRQ